MIHPRHTLRSVRFDRQITRINHINQKFNWPRVKLKQSDSKPDSSWRISPIFELIWARILMQWDIPIHELRAKNHYIIVYTIVHRIKFCHQNEQKNKMFLYIYKNHRNLVTVYTTQTVWFNKLKHYVTSLMLFIN